MGRNSVERQMYQVHVVGTVLSASLINGYPLNKQSSLAGNLSRDNCTVLQRKEVVPLRYLLLDG